MIALHLQKIDLEIGHIASVSISPVSPAYIPQKSKLEEKMFFELLRSNKFLRN